MKRSSYETLGAVYGGVACWLSLTVGWFLVFHARVQVAFARNFRSQAAINNEKTPRTEICRPRQPSKMFEAPS